MNDIVEPSGGRRLRTNSRSLAYLGTLAVLYAVFDLVSIWIRVQRLADSALANHITMMAPLTLMLDSILLVGAAVSFRTGKRIGLATSLVLNLWLLVRGFNKWLDVASVVDVRPLSRSAVVKWMALADGAWDFPRLLLSLAMASFVLASLLQRVAVRENLTKVE